MQNYGRVVFLPILVILMMGGVSARAQKDLPPTIDCSLDGRPLTCNRIEFLKRFAEAHTLALESQPKDRAADAQLASFAQSLKKQIVPDLPADITLHLVRTGGAGVEVGPGDMELGSLRVFSTRKGPEASHLLWVESYHGQADMPWIAVVRALTRQLQETLASH